MGCEGGDGRARGVADEETSALKRVAAGKKVWKKEVAARLLHTTNTYGLPILNKAFLNPACGSCAGAWKPT